MAETSKNKIYYNDNENSVADVLADMKKMAESTDKAIENSKYNDAQIKKDISDAKKEQALKDAEQDNKIIELQNEKAKLEKELKEAQEDFYQASIRGQVSGEYIHVEDSSNCRSIIGISGNHEQKMRSGKNCIPNNLIDGTTNGIKYTIDSDKAINLSGTATARTEPRLFYNTTNSLKFKAGTYKNTSDLLIILRCDTYISIPAKSTVVLSEDKEVIEAYFRIEQGETVSGKHYPQIIVNGQDESYEQYGASPSPGYLSEIKTVGSNVNIFDKEKYRNINNWSNSQGFFIYCKLDEEDTTKFKKIITGSISLKGKSQNLVFGISTTNNAGSFNNQYRMLDNETIKNITYDFSNAENIYLCIGNANKIGTDKNEINLIFDNYNIKFEEGTVATPSSPPWQGCVKVTKRNKNIMPINIGTNYAYTSSGIKHLNRENGTEITRFIVKKGQIIKLGLKLISKPTNDTTFSFYFKSNDNNIGSFSHIERNELNQIYEKEYTAIEDGEFFIKIWGSPTPDIFEFQLWAELNILTDYVQHEEQSYIMPTQTEMLENDYLDYDNEEEVHVWGKKILDGTEEINLQWDASDKHGYRIAIDNIKKTTSSSEKSLVISNSYKAYIQDDLFNLKYKAYGISNRYNNSEVIIRNDDITTVTAFKANLKSQYDAGTPVMIYYKLQTPTRLKFTDEQKTAAKELNNARTYKNVTNITTDSKAILSLDYAKDLETLLTSKESEV